MLPANESFNPMKFANCSERSRKPNGSLFQGLDFDGLSSDRYAYNMASKRIKNLWLCISCLCIFSCASKGTKNQTSPVATELSQEYFFPSNNSRQRSTASVADCDLFANNADLQFVRTQIRLEGSRPRTIDGYQLSRQTINYTSLSRFPGCALFERNGAVLFSGELHQLLNIPNGLYNFIQISAGSAPTQTQPTPEVQNLLSAHKISSALVLNVDNPYPSAVEASWKKVLTGVAFHEGFHLFYQQFLSPEPHSNLWPVWDRDSEGFLSSRDEMSKACYLANEATQEMVAAEISTLKRSLLPDTPEDQIRSSLRDFVRRRMQRYQSLVDVKVESRSSCQQVEDQFELFEGMAKFVEISALIRLNLVTDDPVLANYFNPSKGYPGAFYPLGMFQLMVLERLNSGQFRQNVILPILTSKTPQDSVFGQIQKAGMKND